MSTKTAQHIIPPMTTRPNMQEVNASTVDASFLRNHFTILTWLLLGAFSQILLSYLPLRKVYINLPVLVVLLLQTTNHLAIMYGWKRNAYMDGVIPGKVTATFPTSAGSVDDKICVVLLGARSNDPNGVFSKGFRAVGEFFTSMQQDLEGNAATNGFLGATTWLSTSDRATSSELLTVFYFKSHNDVLEWAHGAVHREGWDWWTKLVKSGKAGRLSLMHEIFEAPKGAWECVYLNFKPTGFGSTLHPVRDEKGVLRWVNPLIDAKGTYRSSNGRHGNDERTETADINE